MVRYSTALSHIILAGTAFYCLKFTNKSNLQFARLSFGILGVNSVLGVWRWGNPSYGHKIEKLYRLTSILQDLLALPLIVTNIWLNYHYSLELAYAHTLVALFPLLAYLYNTRNIDVVDGFLAANCISLGLISLTNQNHYGLTTMVSFTLNYFFIKRDVMGYLPGSYYDVPTQDLYNYSMCFFAYFALKAVSDCI
ncbi:uncharacterized protein LOC132696341 [Cylas formicarius]|uniref:uncharacterized protein LOC132696341 n=1 Tax=Cylas formicarius TaxID=197179 RepID=UPI0029588A52|nr:uncharacterized protein LOC132696341 [Cylas formicarius]